MTALVEGQRVRLPAIPADEMPEEAGRVVGTCGDGFVVILLDPQHWDGPNDDGVREVARDQLEAAGELP